MNDSNGIWYSGIIILYIYSISYIIYPHHMYHVLLSSAVERGILAINYCENKQINSDTNSQKCNFKIHLELIEKIPDNTFT